MTRARDEHEVQRHMGEKLTDAGFGMVRSGAVTGALALALAVCGTFGGALAETAPTTVEKPIVPKIILQVGHSGWVNKTAWIVGGAQLLTLGTDQQLIAWDAERGLVADRIALDLPPVTVDRPASVLSVGPTGRYGVAGFENVEEDAPDAPPAPLRMLDLYQHRILGLLPGRPEGWLNDHQLFERPASYSCWDGLCPLTLVNVASGERRALDPTFTGAGRFTLSPDGRFLAATIQPAKPKQGESRGLLRVWRTADLKLQWQTAAPEGGVGQMEFNSDSRRLVVRTGNHMFVVEVATGARTTQELQPAEGARILRVDVDAGTMLLAKKSSSDCGSVELATFANAPLAAVDGSLEVNGVMGRHIVIDRYYCEGGGEVLMDTVTGALRPLPSFISKPSYFGMSPDGRRWIITRTINAATGAEAGYENGEPVSTLYTQALDAPTDGRILAGVLRDFPRQIEVSPDGRRVASWFEQACSQSCAPLRIFNIADGRFDAPILFPVTAKAQQDSDKTKDGITLTWISGDLLALKEANVATTLVDLADRRTRRLPIASATPLGRPGLWVGLAMLDPETKDDKLPNEGPVVYDEAKGAITRRFAPFPQDTSKPTGEAGPTLPLDVSVSPDNTTLAATALGFAGGYDIRGRVGLWDIASGRFREAEHDQLPFVGKLRFSPDSQRVYTDGFDEHGLPDSVREHDSARVWDVVTGRRQISHMPQNPQGWRTFPGPGNRIALVGSGPHVIVADALSGRTLASLGATGKAVKSAGFLKKAPALWATGDDGSVRLWSTRDWSELFTLYLLPNEQWMLVSPTGAYDTNLPADTKAMGWLMEDRPLKLLGPQTFMRDYFEPGLGGRLMACNLAGTCGNMPKPKRRLQDLNRTLPMVTIAGVRPAEGSAVWVDLDVKEDLDPDAPNGKTRSGLHDLRLFRDGRLVGQSPTPMPAAPGAADVDSDRWATATALKAGRQSFKVQLPQGGDGKPGKFTAYAFNDDRVKGETAELAYTPPSGAAAPRRAYVIAVGVNAYALPGKSLSFAVNDANAIAGALKQIAGYETVTVRLVADGRQDHAAKADLQAVLARLAGQSTGDKRLAAAGIDATQLRTATPDDLVILSFSGHGYADAAGRFVLLPSDAALANDDQLDLASLISSAELTDWLRGVDAGEMAMIIDACHSGASVTAGGFKPGPMGDPGLGQLAFDKGIRILAASQAAEVALEDAGLRQGLLTYGLVHDGLSGAAGDLRLDQWLRFGAERLPGLSRERQAAAAAGRSQSSSGIEVDDDGSAVQQPQLFDFTGRPSPVTLRRAGASVPAGQGAQ